MLHRIIEYIYALIGKCLLGRACYITTCSVCGNQKEQYFPYRGAFVWESEYWRSFQPDMCCGKRMAIERSFDGRSGALYRLPGYKRHDQASLKRSLTKKRRCF